MLLAARTTSWTKATIGATLLAGLGLLLARAPAPRTASPSFLVIVLDDLGTDMVGCYGDPEAPCTPRLDQFAAAGMRLTRAYAAPTCSPTRAAIFTGRYGFRTGIGSPVQAGEPGLLHSETTIAEHLGAAGYETALIGKWHLRGDGFPDSDPNDQGWGTYRGCVNGRLSPNYTDWQRTVNGVTAQETMYATTRTTADALTVMGTLQEPFLEVVCYNAPHAPFQDPPAAACPENPCACPAGPQKQNEDRYRAMIESVDEHVGILVTAAVAAYPDLYVMVLGDNGTPQDFDAPCPRGRKGLLYEGGIGVPWLVLGPGISSGSASSALVGVSDIFATLCELAGVAPPASAQDSASFAGVLTGGGGARESVYQEWFTPVGLPFLPTEHRRTVVEPRWKLVRRTGSAVLPPVELFDLEADPCEAVNLYDGTLSVEEQAAYDRLQQELEDLGVG